MQTCYLYFGTKVIILGDIKLQRNNKNNQLIFLKF